jgi:hypothetical protein
MYGTQRNKPTKVPSNLLPSFINLSDDVLTSNINANTALAESLVSDILQNGGDPVIVTFKFADGTTAQYSVSVSTSCSSVPCVTATWTGIAHDAQGRPIKRDGTLVHPTPIPTNPGPQIPVPIPGGPTYTVTPYYSPCPATVDISPDTDDDGSVGDDASARLRVGPVPMDEAVPEIVIVGGGGGGGCN